ncbi:RHS repeat domain-containing protein [Archangium violaceum]|uniref:RHS repeat domain-containing protein n=1 Tax=Archangium violaceum TaxID=83451 RepID=UPI0037BE40D3
MLEAYEYQRYQTGAQPFWTPLRFPGQYHDAETDLFENWNRYYDPSIGRYLQPEPMLHESAVVKALVLRGQSMPVYAYASNNPFHFSDPSGGLPIDGASTDRFLSAEMQISQACQAGDQASCKFMAGQFAAGTFAAAWYSVPLASAEVLAPLVAPAVAKARDVCSNISSNIADNWFRFDSTGRWKNGGQWKSGPHFHFDPYPYSKELMKWHLPFQARQWFYNFRSKWNRYK